MPIHHLGMFKHQVCHPASDPDTVFRKIGGHSKGQFVGAVFTGCQVADVDGFRDL